MGQYAQRGRNGCVSSGPVNLRDSTVEDGVRKRPIFQKFDPLPFSGYQESVAKINIFFEPTKKICKKVGK